MMGTNPIGSATAGDEGVPAATSTRRRRAVAGLLVTIAVLGMASTSCRKPIAFRLDEPFRLAVEAPARLSGGDLDLYFRRVDSDSRCPANATCISAGEALVTMEGRILKGPVESFQVGIPGGPSTPESIPKRLYGGYRIQLLKLEPYPVAGVTADTTAYVGTFRVERR